MNNKKMYIICSILFIAIVIIIVFGFNGTYSAPTGDLGGTGNLYWAIDGNSCDTENAGCLLKISNNLIDGEHYVYGKVDGEKEYYSNTIPWKDYINGITNIIIGSEDDIVKPNYINNWFYNMKFLSVSDLSHLDTSLVTKMNSLFCNTGYNATNFELDISSWDTSNVTTVNQMFYYTGYNATTFNLNMSNLNLSKITNMSWMFYNAAYNSKTVNIDFSNCNTENLLNTDYMFLDTGYNATTFNMNLSDLDTAQVTSMVNMFSSAGSSASNWTIGDLSNWDVSNVTNMAYVFSSAGRNATIWSVGDLSNWNTSNVTNMSGVFSSAGYKATNFDISYVSKWNVSNVEYFDNIFYNTGYNSKTWTVGTLSEWSMSHAISISMMFTSAGYNAQKIELDLSNWDTSNVTKMYSLFSNFGYNSKDITIGNITNWNTSNLQDARFLFSGFKSNYLTYELDLSGWDTSSVTSYDSFLNSSKLHRIIVGDKWTLPLSNKEWMNEDTKEVYETGNIPQNVAATYTVTIYYWAIDGDNCQNSNAGCTLKISNNQISGNHYISSRIDGNTKYYTIPWNDYLSGISNVIVGSEDDIIKPKYIQYWFRNLSYASTLNLSYLDTSLVTDFSYVFYNTGSNVTTFNMDLSNLDTSNATTMQSMLTYTGSNATEWNIGDISNWNITNVTLLSDMFFYAGHNAITWNVGNLSNWDTSNVISISNMFWGAAYNAKYVELDLSNWNVSKVRFMSNAFYDFACNVKKLSIGDISNWDTSSLESTSSLFNHFGKNLSTFELDLSGWDTSKVTSYSTMFDYSQIHKIIVGDKWTLPLSNKKWMNESTKEIYETGNIPKNVAASYIMPIYNWAIDGENCEASNAKCTLKISNNYIDGEHYIYGRFDGNSKYSYNTIPWYAYKKGITTIIVGNENDIIKPKYINYWFYELSNLSYGDLSNLDVSLVTDMNLAFYFTGYYADTFEIDVSNWDVSNVTDMNSMFANTGLESTTWSIGDLSNWNVSNVTDMSFMFGGAGEGAYEFSIGDLSNWNTSKVTNMSSMFHVTGQSAKIIDFGNIGKWDTSNVTNMGSMFYSMGYASNIVNLKDLSGWNTSKVTNMSNMFTQTARYAKNFELDLSGWDTTNVTNSSGMFSNTNSLIKVVVGDKWTLPLSNTKWMNNDTAVIYEAGNIPKNIAGTYYLPTLYWTIYGDSYYTSTLKITNVPLEGNYYYKGSFDRTIEFASTSNVPWYSNKNLIVNIIIGDENDVVTPLYMSNWFNGLNKVVTIDAKYSNTKNVISYDNMFSNNTSLNEVVVGNKWTLPLYNIPWMNKTTEEIYETGNIPQNTEATYIRPLIYWAVIGQSCTTNGSSCKLKISGSNITDLAYSKGTIEKTATYASASSVPWYLYRNSIKNIVIGDENDIISPLSINYWFSDLYNVNSIDLTYLDITKTASYVDLFNNTNSLTLIKVNDKWNIPLSNNRWMDKNTEIVYEDGNIPQNEETTYVRPLIYWMIDGESCDSEKSSCTLKISNNFIDGTHYSSGYFENNVEFKLNNLTPWYIYKNGITNLIIGGENDIVKPLSTSYWFYNLYYLSTGDISNLDTSKVKNMNYMFSYVGKEATSFNLDLSNLNTSNVNNMEGMLEWIGCDATEWNIGNIENFDTSNVINMKHILSYSGYNAETFEFDLSKWNVSNVENMEGMLEWAGSNATTWSIGDISNWNVSNVTNMKDSLSGIGGTLKTFEMDLRKWDVSNVTNMFGMFYCIGYYADTIKLNLSGWNLQNILDIRDIFLCIGEDTAKSINIDLSNWNTSNITSFNEMFLWSGNVAETYIIDLTGWDTSNAIDMSRMFEGVGKNATTFKINGLENFDTSNAIDMSYMFCNTGVDTDTFKLDISNFNTSNVENIEGIFYNTGNNVEEYELDLSNFDTSKVQNSKDMFVNSESLTKINVGNAWNLQLGENIWINNENGELYHTNEIPQNIKATYVKPIVYWSIDNDTLILSSKKINSSISGILDTSKYNVPWEEYKESIKNIIIGSEDDIIKPYNIDEWFKDMSLVKELNLNYVDSSILHSANNLFNNMSSLEKLNMRDLDLRNVDDSVQSSNLFLNIFKKVSNNSTNIVLFAYNNKLKEISVGVNNINVVKGSLENPSSEYIDGATGVWYEVNGESYDVSELPEDKDATYYALKPHKVSYNVDSVESQAKFVGEDLRLYDEIIKESDISEIITKFDTVGGNVIDNIVSLKITTYTLKNFTDKDGNIYLPGSIYTIDDDLELDVNYDEDVYYNSIELPIPVKHGYKFEYWTLDGERIDEYTPKSNKTLESVWTEIKYNFSDNEIEFKKESTKSVIFETDGIIENFIGLYVNGKRLELGRDYVINENKIILTNNGIEYLDSLETEEYEVKAEFADSNNYVYGIIKVSEKEVVTEEEPEDKPKEEPKANPITPKTSDYILFTIIIAITALISSIFVYKKIEY